MRRLCRVLSLLAASFVVTLITACGSNAPAALSESGATLEGTITHNGKPVHFALVIVQAIDGRGALATGSVGPHGRYVIQNAPTGEVKVAVNTDAGKGDLTTAHMQAGEYTGPDGHKKKRVSLDYNQVPKKYHEPNTSSIHTTIQKGNNTFDFDVPAK